MLTMAVFYLNSSSNYWTRIVIVCLRFYVHHLLKYIFEDCVQKIRL